MPVDDRNTSAESGTPATRELARETWSEYFDALSKELLGAEMSIAIIGQTDALPVPEDQLALKTLTYDGRDDVFEVTATKAGQSRPAAVRHLVDQPQRVTVDNHTLLAPMTIAIDGRDRVRTVIHIGRDPEFTG